MIAENERLYLPHSTTCFICGAHNDVGLKCRFFTESSGNVHLYSNLERKYAGFTDVIHGGIQSAMLDEAMGWCGFTQTDSEVLFFTRDLSVKFRKNLTASTPFFLEAKLTDMKRGLIMAEGRIRDESGSILTTASGTFVPIPEAKMAETKNGLLFINDGRKYYEKALRICSPQPSIK